MLEICKFFHATVGRKKGKGKMKMSGFGMEAAGEETNSLVVLEERLPLELLKGKSPAD
jgi:hypothetical protein